MSATNNIPGGFGDVPTFPIDIPAYSGDSPTSVNVTLRNPFDIGCPLGYICNNVYQASCLEIQQVAVKDFGFGDIHAGAYCPANVPFYVNCPIGYYCPDPSTLLPCPAGYFCPHKTAKPEIICMRCSEGATVLVRDLFGYIVFAVIAVAVVIYLVYYYTLRHVDYLRHRVEALSSRMFSFSEVERRTEERQDRLIRILPKLKLLNQRMHDNVMPTLSENSATTPEEQRFSASNSLLEVSARGKVKFNVVEFFQALDKNHDQDLSYDELNRVLQFDELQLNDFVRRMNTLDADSPADADHVSKVTFCNYFLEVLEETSNFRLTPEEAGDRWDELANEQGTNMRGEVPFDAFYESSILSNFLSDVQIKDVIVRMKRVKDENRDRVPPVSFQRGPSSVSSMDSPSRPSRRGSGLGKVVPASQTFSKEGISRDLFSEHYPVILETILMEASNPTKEKKAGIDIAFSNLKLSVKVGADKYLNVVDDVTGRIRQGTMTALLGGSGAGKTSLLNALCGRAYYGEVHGDVMINGNKASVEDFSESIGFVPQDDIVFAELTVRENLMFSGRFRLPQNTPLREIEELVETVLANLGLARKANSIVGDVTRRGLSGGEKKRVNIGLELMANPTALFLDEPTSGLDASSALLVMKSLEQLVKNQGVTVCSVIHQPRKFIFDLFDSIILLGAGGRMVYHGTVPNAEKYFTSLGYTLPMGESLADWLIDISTGRIAPDHAVREEIEDEENGGMISSNAPPQVSNGLTIRNLYGSSRTRPANVNIDDGKVEVVDRMPEATRTDRDIVSSAGPSGNRQAKVTDEAKLRRELLYQAWNEYFESLDASARVVYDSPEAYDPPVKTPLPSTFVQFYLQMQRIFLLSWRNRVTKTIETTIVVGAVAVITLFEGTATLSVEDTPFVPFEAFIGQPQIITYFFRPLFAYSIKASTSYIRYGVSVGVIGSVMIALISVKAITEKRLEFYREAGSGYNINAYFLAVNVFTSIDQGIQILLAALIAQWLLNTVADKAVFLVAFLLLAWISVSWSLLISLITPPENTLVLLGFFVSFFGLLFGGTNPPVLFADIYKSAGTALFSAFVSPPRFVTETLAVSDLKCLPAQSGFTQSDQATNFPPESDSFFFISLGQSDSNVTEKYCGGWYHNILPGFLVGLTLRFAAFGAINCFNRAKQAKKSFWFQLRNKGSKSLYFSVALYWVCLGTLFGITCWTIVRKT